MQYIITFLEGVITFVSPCLLPLLPVYISFFAGGHADKKMHVVKNALGFILGFTIVFVLLGVFAGTVGKLLQERQTAVNIITGSIVVIFGLHYLGVLRIDLLDRTLRLNANTRNLGFASSLLFGVVFSLGWTPCVGVFLGSALMMASQQGSSAQGFWLLLCYSAGLGIPFLLSAVLIDSLKTALAAIKKRYALINRVAGILLVAVGITMMTGHMGRLLFLLSY